jgi:hypothetical protein
VLTAWWRGPCESFAAFAVDFGASLCLPVFRFPSKIALARSGERLRSPLVRFRLVAARSLLRSVRFCRFEPFSSV